MTKKSDKFNTIIKSNTIPWKAKKISFKDKQKNI